MCVLDEFIKPLPFHKVKFFLEEGVSSLLVFVLLKLDVYI